MAISNAATRVSPPSGVGIVQQLAVDQVSGWCSVLDRFIQWQSQNMLRAQPSAKQREDHRQGLKWLLRLSRLIHSVASDPDFPDRSLLGQLEAQMRQIEESWELFYNQSPAAEAEAVLREAFPDAS